MNAQTATQRPTASVVGMVEPAVAERLERLAASHDRTVSAEVRRAVRQYLEQETNR